MMKHILVTLSVALLLIGCSSPNYGDEKDLEYTAIPSTEVVSLFGVVVGITEDNQLEIKVKKSEEVEDSGLQVNKDGIVKVALAATNISELNPEENEALHELLSSNILNEDVMVEIIDPQQNKLIEGFVSFAGENDSIVLIQDLLQYEFVTDLINNETLSSFKPHLKSLEERAKSEMLKMFNLLDSRE